MSDDRPDADENPLQALLHDLTAAADGETTRLGEFVAAVGRDSFSGVLLAMALLAVTPLSGIPTVPTISAVIIAFVTVQWIVKRTHLWLPGWALNRRVSSDKARAALDWLRPAARWFDQRQRARLVALTRGPLNRIALTLILATVATWPFLELLPFFTTVTAVGIALMAFGLMTRDGVWVLAGMAYSAVLWAVLLRLV